MQTLSRGFGTLVEAQTASEAIINGGLNWEIGGEPIKRPNGDIIGSHKSIVRLDNNEVLGIVGEGYTPVQNRDCFGLMDEVIGSGHAKFERVYSFKGGRRIGILARMPFDIPLKGGKDNVGLYLRLQTGHDGSQGLLLDYLPVRGICWNAVNVDVAQELKGRRFYAKHTLNVGRKLDVAQVVLNAQNYIDMLQPKFEFLAKATVSEDYINRILNKIFEIEDKEKVSTRALNEIAEVKDRIFNGTGNSGETRWDVLSGITEYVDHFRPTRGDAENRVISFLDGSGRDLVNKAFEELLVA